MTPACAIDTFTTWGGVSGGWWIIAGGRGFEGWRGGVERGGMTTTAAAKSGCGRTVGVCGFKMGTVIGAHMHGHLGTLERGPTLNQIMTTGRGVRE